MIDAETTRTKNVRAFLIYSKVAVEVCTSLTEEREIFYLAPKAKTGVEDVRNMRYVHCACQRIYAENRLKK